MPTSSKSGYRGVMWDAARKRWQVRIWDPAEYHLRHGGYFEDVEVAARRYDELAIQLGLGKLNFPPAEKRKRASASGQENVLIGVDAGGSAEVHDG